MYVFWQLLCYFVSNVYVGLGVLTGRGRCCFGEHADCLFGFEGGKLGWVSLSAAVEAAGAIETVVLAITLVDA